MVSKQTYRNVMLSPLLTHEAQRWESGRILLRIAWLSIQVPPPNISSVAVFPPKKMGRKRKGREEEGKENAPSQSCLARSVLLNQNKHVQNLPPESPEKICPVFRIPCKFTIRKYFLKQKYNHSFWTFHYCSYSLLRKELTALLFEQAPSVTVSRSVPCADESLSMWDYFGPLPIPWIIYSFILIDLFSS